MNSIQEKLSRFETPPPSGAWEAIEAALDAQSGAAQRLHDFEVAPPQGTWNAIEAALPVGGKVRSLTSRDRLVMAAAAVLLLLASASIFLLQRNTASDDPIASNTNGVQQPRPVVESNSPAGPSVIQPANETNGEIESTIAAEAPVIAAREVRRKPVLTAREIEPDWNTLHESGAAFQYLPPAGDKKLELQTEAEKYMVIVNNEGNAVRLSKKLFDEYECATREQACRQRIRELQTKISSAAVDSDFTSLIDMLQRLREKP